MLLQPIRGIDVAGLSGALFSHDATSLLLEKTEHLLKKFNLFLKKEERFCVTIFIKDLLKHF